MTGSAVCASRYTGKERDTESGDDYFGARYYSSAMGRFMSPDYNDEGDEIKPVPYANLEDPQGLNQYAYAGNNPLTNIDPDGHCGQRTTFTTSFPGFPTQTTTVVDRSDCQNGLNVLQSQAYEALLRDRWNHPHNWAQDMSFPVFRFMDKYPSIFGNSCPPGGCTQLYGLPWGMTGGLGGASGLLSGAEQNALKGVLKGIESGAEKGRPFFNQARAAYGGVSPLPAQAAGYYRRFTVSLGAGKGAFRLVTGLGGEMYATFDHYISWVKLK